ncbi:MAG TPA: nucleotidyltransferase family protein, partial [Ilumatobacteraceae bacterium]|nr:nucleotidyltransferase family protein [Ilumatobacteraceae bacterium]
VPATPVKGAELVNGIWPYPSARPMSDIDLVVPVELRAQATAALVAAGFMFDGATPHEDTFLAWGDGSVGRTDGESADHNGKVELHPGWNEFIHGYMVDGLSIDAHATMRPLDGVDCARLDLAAVTTSVIGHLSSTVVRCEVRALNVVDVWFCHSAGVQWPAVGKLLDECDPRLTGPGLWLLARLLPDMAPAVIVDRQIGRLPNAARRRLAGLEPASTFRNASSRTTLGWRQAFARNPSERIAVLRQMGRSARVRR